MSPPPSGYFKLPDSGAVSERGEHQPLGIANGRRAVVVEERVAVQDPFFEDVVPATDVVERDGDLV